MLCRCGSGEVFFVRLAQHRGNFRQCGHGQIEIGRTLFRMFSFRAVDLVAKLLRFQPFAQMNTFLIVTVLLTVFQQIVRISLHHRPAPAQDLPIPETPVIAVRDKVNGIRPAHGGPGSSVHHLHTVIGQYSRDQAIFILTILHIPQPFLKEGGRVHKIRTGIKEYLCIACPAQTLPGRAIRGNVQEIALHTPARVFDQLIYPLIRACKIARLLQVGVDCNGFEVLRGKFRNSKDLRVTEPEGSERSLIGILFPGAGEQDLLQRCLHALAFDRPCHQLLHELKLRPAGCRFRLHRISDNFLRVRIIQFRTDNTDALPFFALYPERQISGEILPEIQYISGQQRRYETFVFRNRYVIRGAEHNADR